MRIVLGEVSETDGEYKMLRAVHMTLSDEDFEQEPEAFIDKFLYPAVQQLVSWHDEAQVKH